MRRKFPAKRILVIRLTAIGDIVMASPIASAIKRQNPNSVITWVVHPGFKSLLEGHPDIDELLTFDLSRWQDLWRAKRFIQMTRFLQSLRKDLHQRNIDQAIDLQGKVITGMIARLSGAKHRIALGSEDGNSLFVTKSISRNLGEQTQIGAEYRYLVNQLGCSDSPWEMHLPENDTATDSASRKLKEKIHDARYAVICPFSEYPQKNWFNDYWEQIVLRIRGRYHLKTVIVGGQNGFEAGEKMAKLTGAVNMAGRTNLAETTAIIRGAALLIGVDTGLTHIGHALGIPSISLFGATYPYAFVDNEASRIIYMDRFCSPCRRNPTCKGKYQCMRDITPDKVLTAIKPLISSTALNLTH